jgi:hypothetical protein
VHLQFPEADYPAGLTAFGALVTKRGGVFPADVPEDAPTTADGIRLWSVPGTGSAQRITFQLPQAASVTLAVYNVVGQQVARLMENNTRMAAGQHAAPWFPQASGSSSGIYFAKLTVDGSREMTTKVVLVR